MMTHHVRLLKGATPGPSTWRELRSPPAANDVVASLVPLTRSLPKSPDEVAILLTTLDLTEPNDLRAAAMLVLLGLGLGKQELTELDVSDVVLVGAVVCLSVRSRARRGKGKQSFLPIIGPEARMLKAYLSRQHDEAAALSSPLFFSVEHGQSAPLRRITPSAISYWLFELRLRARQALAEKRGTPRASNPKPRLGATRGVRG